MRQRDLGGLSVSDLCLGAMMFGTTIDEDTSYAVLDGFVEAGGTFIDTANCYQFWEAGGQGHESEELLGRWLKSRGLASGSGRDQIVIATKVGARPDPNRGRSWPDNREGVSAAVISAQIDASLERLGLEHVDLYYSHHEDRRTPIEETVEGFARVVRSGKARVLGVSNEPSWRIERARRLAAERELPGYACIQQRYSYLRQRPGAYDSWSPLATAELLDYVNSDPGLTMVAFSPLLGGAYSDRRDKPLDARYDHPGTQPRLRVLREVADETGATPNQVVLAWMLAATPSVLPLFGASSLGQLRESLGALDVRLDAAQLERLDAA